MKREITIVISRTMDNNLNTIQRIQDLNYQMLDNVARIEMAKCLIRIEKDFPRPSSKGRRFYYGRKIDTLKLENETFRREIRTEKKKIITLLN